MQKLDEVLDALRAERADNDRLIRALDKSEAYAADCAQQCGDLAEGVAKALGMGYVLVVPDDVRIIERATTTVTQLRNATALLAEALGQLETHSGFSAYSRIHSMAGEKLAARIHCFLGELDASRIKD
jgi:hypothetical protein